MCQGNSYILFSILVKDVNQEPILRVELGNKTKLTGSSLGIAPVLLRFNS